MREDQEAALITLPLEGHVPDRDLILRWRERATAALDLKSVCCQDSDARYAVVRLDAPADAPVAQQQPHDYYFLVDRSGSMKGAKWTCTALALQAFLGELGDEDRVWVTLFESSFQDFAEAPLPVRVLKADPAFGALGKLGTGGGTDLLPALQHVTSQINLHSIDRPAIMVIITDGQVGNESGVLKLLRNQRQVPIHTFGIDMAVNDAFLKQIAEEHRGACVLMTPNDDIRGGVAHLGNRLRRPVLTDIVLPSAWEPARSLVPDVHAGEHFLVALKGARDGTALEIQGRLPDGSARTFRFDLHPESIESPRLLWAKQAISRCLAEDRKDEAIKLAVQHNLICPGTAFIAFDEKEKVAIAREEVYQPSMEECAIAVSLGAKAAPAILPAASTAKRFRLESSPPAANASPKASMRPMPSAAPRKGDTQRLPDLSTPSLTPREGFLATLAEIRRRHLSFKTQLTLQSQMLIEQWRTEASALPSFQAPAGHPKTIGLRDRYRGCPYLLR